MEEHNESILNDYPNIISYECSKKIIEQMEKNICKINIGKNQGTGFFCKIPFPNSEKMLPVIITNNHIINNELLNQEDAKIKLDIKEEDNLKEIVLNKNRKKYTNEEYDITIIEIKKEDNINNYLELDNIIINDLLNNKNKNKEYINETIYIMQYPENKLSVSYGILDKIYEDKKYYFNHKCSTKGGSSGSPILNLNNKIIGIHKGGNNNYNYNKGTFLNYPIKEFIELSKKNNEILLKEFDISKYNLKSSDVKNNELDLKLINFENEGLKNLSIYQEIKTNKISEDEFIELLKEYPYINDNIKVKKRNPQENKQDKSIYYGEWDINYNLRHGRGIQLWSDGAKYIGYWKNDKQEGKGKEFFSDGTKYEGEYKEGKKNGKGKFIWPDGSVYIGNFKNNHINGYGTYTFSDMRKYEGNWVENKFEGKGIFTWPDGRTYEGEYVQDKKEGYGIYKWANGNIYKGQWKNGKQDGKGEFYSSLDKIWKSGIWKEGKRVKWI